MWSLSHAAIWLAIIAQSHAHMILRYPPPIGDPNNSPLDNAQRNPAASGGGSYPCKVQSPADYQSAPVTTFERGSSVPVTFTGSAVHGGGSCQFSLSKDLAPTVDSKFKVIHSVEGGCPARNQAGNFPADASFLDPDVYNVTLPEQLTNGRYTFSWTWVNKVGNREFYMNCAAISVGDESNTPSVAARQDSPTGGDDPFFDSLPDMVVLNTDTDDCVGTNPEGSFLYADPGNSLEINEADIPQANMVLPQCAAGGGKITQAVRNAPSATPTDSNPSSIPSATPDAFPAQDPSSIPSEPSSSPLSSPTTTPTPQPPSSSCPSPQTPCTALGFSCIDTTTFVLCGQIGDCATPQSVSAGTVCVDNAIQQSPDTGSPEVRSDARWKSRLYRYRRANPIF